MLNVKDVFKGNSRWDWDTDYDTLINTFEYETIISDDAGSYQGDSWRILKNGSQYGYLEFGWGSCSGCDALQACASHEDLEELQNSLHNDIKWFDNLDSLKDYFKNHDWEGDWCWHKEEFKKVYK